MDKTRASLRRVRGYAAVVVMCLLYACLPPTHREIAQQRANWLMQSAMDWTACR